MAPRPCLCFNVKEDCLEKSIGGLLDVDRPTRITEVTLVPRNPGPPYWTVYVWTKFRKGEQAVARGREMSNLLKRFNFLDERIG